jgi:hypothetical protein
MQWLHFGGFLLVVHYVNCLVCSFVKGKDVILGPKANTFENHVGEIKGSLKYVTLGQETRKMVCQ